MASSSQKVLLSVGPMRSYLDPVRYIQNRSSGKMGLAIAQAAVRAGNLVTVLLGPVSDTLRVQFTDCEIHSYETSTEYGNALSVLFPKCDLFISAAAVLDFDFAFSPVKWDRNVVFSQANPALHLPVQQVPDFARRCGLEKNHAQRVIAFAAEVGPIETCLARARAKLLAKHADLLFMNPVGTDTGPETDTNQLWCLLPSDKAKDQPESIALGRADKTLLGEKVWEHIQKYS